MPQPPSPPDRWGAPPRRAFTYAVPATLTELARQISSALRSIAYYETHDQPRSHPLSADQTAALLLDWALEAVQRNPSLLPACSRPAPARLVAWDGWERPQTPRALPPAPAHRQTAGTPCYIAYRWPPASDQAIRRLARAQGLRIGETALRLLEIAIQGYRQREFDIVQEPLTPRS